MNLNVDSKKDLLKTFNSISSWNRCNSIYRYKHLKRFFVNKTEKILFQWQHFCNFALKVCLWGWMEVQTFKLIQIDISAKKITFLKEPLEENSIFKAITHIYQMAFRSFKETLIVKHLNFPSMTFNLLLFRI